MATNDASDVFDPPKFEAYAAPTPVASSAGASDLSDSPLRVSGLYKQYGHQLALNNMTFSVPRGSCTGLVGPNGAGKSTTLRSVVGLVRVDGGMIEVCGHRIIGASEEELIEARRQLGVVTDPLQLFDRLSGRDFVLFLARLRGLDRDIAEERATDLFNVLDLAEDSTRPISGYSHGMKKKTALAAALIHRPSLLLLDEPFEGVDPVSARTMRAMIDRVRAGGGTVLLSSHVMEIVERLCDYVVVVSRGSAVAEGPIDELRGGRRLEDVFVDIVGAVDSDMSSLDWLG